MASSDLDTALQAMGMDAEEARLYTILVATGPNTVGSIAPAAGLSRTKAYSVLDRMVTKGYLELVADHPKTYSPTDPMELLRRRVEELGIARHVIEEEVLPILEQQGSRSRNLSLRGSAVFSRAEEMVKRAKREIVLVASFIPNEMTNRLANLLAELHSRGVKVRTVMSDAVSDSALLAKLRNLTDLRVRKVPNAGMLIVDDEEVLIGSMASPHGSSDGRDPVARIHGLWSRDRELISLQRMLFEDIYGEGVA